jgi:hypothetical protein
MSHHMLPLAGISSFIVTADDGTLFHCQPHQVRGEGNGNGSAADEVRWIFIDTKHVRHVGPVYEGQVAPQTLQRMLTDWWRKAR